MAHVLIREGFEYPLKAASQLFPKCPVTLVPGASGANQVRLAGTSTDRPFGFTRDGASQGKQVAVYEEGNYVKAICAASVGFGGEVGVASLGVATNAASGGATVAMLGPIAAATASLNWAVGIAFDNAAAGETFTVFIKPRQLGAPI